MNNIELEVEKDDSASKSTSKKSVDSNVFLFKLNEEFVDSYRSKKTPFGYADSAGNSVGEITFLRTYSRLKDDGTKENWVDVCERVVNGMYSLQKEHCKVNRLPWNDAKAQASAKECFDRMFNFKWTPPGRGLWIMGTPIVMEQKNSAALQNCSFVSTADMTKNNPAKPFAFLMEASMLGVGVGFDDKGADKDFTIYEPSRSTVVEVIEDSREGWVESTVLLINSYLKPDQNVVEFDYSLIRPAGTPIKTFGGTAAGADPLIKLHNHIRKMFSGRAGEKLTRVDIADIGNTIGVCVVSGNVRRSAELLIGRLDDDQFLNLKNAEVFPERNSYDSTAPGWGWMSNNSVEVSVGSDLSGIIDGIALNGEPGVIWMDMSRKYGRLADPPTNKDWRVSGYNPCAEQSLESYECCVSGDTKIQTRDGLVPIRDVLGQGVEIWNGEEWAKVAPFFTGINDLYRVTLSDGSYLDVTPGHEWSVRSGRSYKKVTTAQLRIGDKLPEFDLGAFSGGESFKDAYTWGWFIGDGYVDGRYAIGIVQDKELASVGSSLGGRKRSMQKDYRTGTPWHPVVFDIPLDAASKMRSEDCIPSDVFGWDQDSLSRFFGGWIDTDGTMSRGLNTDHYVLYGTEGKLRDAQLLLRRIGVNHASLRLHQPAGAATNLGIRNADQYRLVIPSYECGNIKTVLKKVERIGSRFKNNNAKEGSIIDAARKQKIVSIEHIAADQPTFCFNEPKRGMGVFGNVLTYQCTLVETYLNRHDSIEDFKRTLKFAYLYAKTVTLLPTHWEETNAIMQRNRRIGTSISGVANFADINGMPVLRDWMDQGYQTVQRYDNIYSEWLGIRESIKTTTVKPSGCQKPETLVVTNSGILTLGELGNINGETWQDSTLGKTVPNEYGEIKGVGKFYNNGIKLTKKITLSSGLTLESTHNHQYRVLRDGEWEWIPADEISVNDVIPYVCGFYDNQSNFELKQAPAAKHNALNVVRATTQHLNTDLAWFLGLYFGDGSNHNKGIRIAGSIKHLEDLEKALLIAEEQLGLTGKIYYRTKSKNNADLYINSTHLLGWLEVNGFLKQKTKSISIPLAIRCSSPQVIDSFISGYCAADGVINHCGRAIVTTSKTMAEQVVVALRAIGSDASVREMPPTKTSWGSSMRYWIQEKLGRNGDTTRLPKKVQLAIMQLDEIGLKNAMPDFVTEINDGETHTLDIEVPDGNTYIANSYVSHNTVSILAGESPGVHWTPGGQYFMRAIRFANDDPMLPLFRMANYRVEPASESPDTTSVVFFPIKSDAKRSEKDVTIFEKMALAAAAQRYWSDNSVSVTISFDSDTEEQHVGTVLHMYDGQLKTVSFLPSGNFIYPQMPYTQITEDEYLESSMNLFPIDLSGVYAGLAADAIGESYCTTSSCEIKLIKENIKG